MIIEIKYNPISFKTELKCSNKTVQNNLKSDIKSYENGRITEWFEKFLKRAKEETNKDPFNLSISSIDEYEKEYIDGILKNEKKILFTAELDTDIDVKYRHIDNFIHFALHSYDQIVKSAMEPHLINIAKFKSNKIEVPVIATMSSGKSTLLNALIGQNFLHEDTGATTATTCEIKVNNSMTTFQASAIIDKQIEITTDGIQRFIEIWNEKANKENIQLILEGPIDKLETQGFDFSFIDTPGPNSTKNKSHKERTYNYIRDTEKLPIVMYVLDPENMDSNDSDATLKEISAVLKENRQDVDRIIFIINKIDQEDLSKKSMEQVVSKVVNFLEKHFEILNPKIFPVSAQYGKLCQLDSDLLSKKEKSTLKLYRENFYPDDSDSGYELLKHSPLSETQKQNLKNTIENCEQDADLVYSGLAAIKLHIEDYILYHHKRNQYHELQTIANSVFNLIKSHIDKKKDELTHKTDQEINENKEKTEQELNRLKENIDKLKNDANNIVIQTSFIKRAASRIEHDFLEIKQKVFSKDEFSEREARQIWHETNQILENLSISINSALNNKTTEVFNTMIKVLKSTISKYFTNDNINVDITFINNIMINEISSILPSFL